MLLADEERLPSGAALGPYVVQDYIASGATSTLYRVRHAKDGHIFAAKIMSAALYQDPIMRERFILESEVLKVFDHPHIVRLHDILTSATGDPIFIMEFVDGSTLEAYIPLHPGGLSEVLTLSIGIQLLDALVYAHERGVVHRDLKPSNVLLEQDHFGGLKAYVADFGLAKILDARAKTATGLRLGTIAYMAPEQVRDSSRVDARADIYALGITLYECLTGTLPFPHASLRDILEAHLTTPIPPVRNQRLDLSPEWDHIITRACAKDRDDRYASAPAMLADLGKLSRTLSLDERTTQAVAPIRLSSPDLAQTTSAGRPGPGALHALNRQNLRPLPPSPPADLAPSAPHSDAPYSPQPPLADPGSALGTASTVEFSRDEIDAFIPTRSLAPIAPSPTSARDDGPLTSWAFTHGVSQTPLTSPPPPAPSPPPAISPNSVGIPTLFWVLAALAAVLVLGALAWLLV
jgi:serine/threonine protein kinase